jgi:hypothetical protein
LHPPSLISPTANYFRRIKEKEDYEAELIAREDERKSKEILDRNKARIMEGI